jgi:hypothetical protein
MVASIVRAPLVWSRLKSLRATSESSAEQFLSDFLTRESRPVLVAWDYPERKYLKHFLLKNGYRCTHGQAFEGGHLRIFEPDRADGEAVTAVSIYYTSEVLPVDVLQRVQGASPGSILYLGHPREIPTLFQDRPAVAMMVDHPAIFRVRRPARGDREAPGEEGGARKDGSDG